MTTTMKYRPLTRRDNSLTVAAADMATPLVNQIKSQTEGLTGDLTHDLCARFMLDQWGASIEPAPGDKAADVANTLHAMIDGLPDTHRIHRQCYMRAGTSAWQARSLLNGMPAELRKEIEESTKLNERLPGLKPAPEKVKAMRDGVASALEVIADREDKYREALYSVFGYGASEAMLDDAETDLTLRNATPNIIKFLRQIGAFREAFTAAKKTKMRKGDVGQLSGVHPGRSIRSLLPMERALLTHPSTRLRQLDRLMKGQTMTYEHMERVTAKMGPVAIMLDRSGSMNSPAKGGQPKKMESAKAIVIALVAELAAQGRKATLTVFDDYADPIELDWSSPSTIAATVCRVAKVRSRGGTNFDAAMHGVATTSPAGADWLLVTDGQGKFSPSQHNLKGRRLAYIALGEQRLVVPDLKKAATWSHVVDNLNDAVATMANILV